MARRSPAAARAIAGAVARWAPHRRGAVVAVLGPDGAGKGTVIAGLAASGLDLTIVYLGRPPRPRVLESARARAGAPAAPSVLRECAGLVLKAVRQLRILAAAYRAAWRGRTVVCDRHPVEVLAIRPQRTPLGARLEHLIAARLLPRPDAIVLLDAPGALLHARKGEHSPEVLERWRRGYLEAFGDRAVIVATDGSVHDSIRAAAAAVQAAAAERGGGPRCR